MCVAIAAVGCLQGHPPPPTQMRIDDLLAASDEAAQRFVRELGEMVKKDFGGYRVAVIIGDIENRSRSMPQSDFELIRQRLRSKLMSSDTLRDHVSFREKHERITRAARREVPRDNNDVLGDSKATPTVELSNPAHSYLLNVDADAVHRGPAKLFAVTFTLTRVSNKDIVFNKYFEVRYGAS
jgi:hypothetical protein